MRQRPHHIIKILISVPYNNKESQCHKKSYVKIRMAPQRLELEQMFGSKWNIKGNYLLSELSNMIFSFKGSLKRVVQKNNLLRKVVAPDQLQDDEYEFKEKFTIYNLSVKNNDVNKLNKLDLAINKH